MRNPMRIPILSNAAVIERAKSLLTQHGYEKELPVDVELLAERELGLDITPIPGFRQRGIDGLLAQDLATIYVDENVQRNVVTRYRFTLAHEIGHLVLHGDVIRQHFLGAENEFLMLWETLSEEEYDHAERQANVFAAALLMPSNLLQSQFENAAANLARVGLTFDSLESHSKLKLVRALSSEFAVSPDSLRIRLVREGLISDFESSDRYS
jgi:Zn-dependent peptidase ImmA (M78 family)